MARIRTIKPAFFRHELLQDLEAAHAGSCPMLVFAGLFGHCDKAGRFLWRPKHLKLDILPFLEFDMADSLAILEKANLVARYNVSGLDYGWIPTFTEHQVIGGKESEAPAKYPEPPREVTEKFRGSGRELTETAGREGKGRELGKEGNRGEGSPPVDKTSTTTAAAGNGAWWKTDRGIDGMGVELSSPARPGESYPQYKARLFSIINAKKVGQ